MLLLKTCSQSQFCRLSDQASKLCGCQNLIILLVSAKPTKLGVCLQDLNLHQDQLVSGVFEIICSTGLFHRLCQKITGNRTLWSQLLFNENMHIQMSKCWLRWKQADRQVMNTLSILLAGNYKMADKLWTPIEWKRSWLATLSSRNSCLSNLHLWLFYFTTCFSFNSEINTWDQRAQIKVPSFSIVFEVEKTGCNEAKKTAFVDIWINCINITCMHFLIYIRQCF